MAQISWRELIVSDADGYQDSLGRMVSTAPENLDTATITDGQITEWPQMFIAAPGEDASWDTPRGEVDWTGFADALQPRRSPRSSEASSRSGRSKHESLPRH